MRQGNVFTGEGLCPVRGSLSGEGLCPGEGGSLSEGGSQRPPYIYDSGRYASYWNLFLSLLRSLSLRMNAPLPLDLPNLIALLHPFLKKRRHSAYVCAKDIKIQLLFTGGSTSGRFFSASWNALWAEQHHMFGSTGQSRGIDMLSQEGKFAQIT